MVIHELKVDQFNTAILSLYRLSDKEAGSYDFSSFENYLINVINPTLKKIQDYFRFDTEYFFPIAIPVINYSFEVSADLDIKPITRQLLKASGKLDIAHINTSFTVLSRELSFTSSNYLKAVTDLYNGIRSSTSTNSVYSSYMDFISKSGVYIQNIVETAEITETELEVVVEDAQEAAGEAVDEVIEEIIVVNPPPTVTPTGPDTGAIAGRIGEAVSGARERAEEEAARVREEYETKKAENDAAKGKAAADLKAAQDALAEAQARAEEAKQAGNNAREFADIVQNGKEGTATYRTSDGELATATRTGDTLTVVVTRGDGTKETTTISKGHVNLPVVGRIETTSFTRTTTETDGTSKTSKGTSYHTEGSSLTDAVAGLVSGAYDENGETIRGEDAREAISVISNETQNYGDQVINDANTAEQAAQQAVEEASNDVGSAEDAVADAIANTPTEPEDTSEDTVSAMAEAAADALSEMGFSDEATQAAAEAFMETYNETGDIDAASAAAAEAAVSTDVTGGGSEGEESNP